MSRWRTDPQAAALEQIERSLEQLDLRGPVLLAGQDGGLSALLGGRDLRVTGWNRRVSSGSPVTVWPPSGPFDEVLLRLAKAKDEQEMTAHAALSVLNGGGRLIVYGGNDEGIRSAARLLEELCGSVEVAAARGHGRVLVARVPERRETLKGSLPQWRRVTPIRLAGVVRQWVTYPGVFAAAQMDDGTQLLLSAMPELGSRARVLDYGCGSGIIGAAAMARESTIRLDMLDNDAVALAAAGENVPEGRVILGATLADAGRAKYDAILSNPPLHSGFAEDHALLEALVSSAPDHLVAGGLLQIVVQRRVPLENLLNRNFTKVSVAAENGRFRVWRAC